MQTHGTKACSKPLDFEVRRVRDNALVDNQNFQYFQEFNKEKGFKCVNEEQQPAGTLCEDYKIRFKCPPAPENGTSIELKCQEKPTDWVLDFNDRRAISSLVTNCTINGYVTFII